MKKFKIAVTKDQKKYTLVFQAENEIQARQRVHKEWYSVLTIEEIFEDVQLGHTFYFLCKNVDEMKSWRVMGDDIFKVYVKLRKDFWYEVLSLYWEQDKDSSADKKHKILKGLEEGYELMQSKNKDKEEEKPKENKKNEVNEKSLDDFYLKKELDENYKLIDFVLEKIKNLIENNEIDDLDIDQKEKLKRIHNSIVKIKKTTNIAKLKEVWELALLKIWMIELRELERNKSKEAKQYLKETNNLLRKFGSSKQFIEKDKDLKLKANTLLEKIFDYFDEVELKKNKKRIKVDKTSHAYIKNQLLLKKYEDRLALNTKNIFKNLIPILLRKPEGVDIIIKRRVLEQNILLLRAKEKWVGYSYTSIKKWYNKFLEKFDTKVAVLRSYAFVLIFLYTIMFLLFLNYQYYFRLDDLAYLNFNYTGLLYFVLFCFVYLGLFYRKSLFYISFIFGILSFLIIFASINF